MSDQKGQEPSDHMDFENIELHSDVDIHSHRPKEPPPSRKERKERKQAAKQARQEGDAPTASGGSSKVLVALLVLLLLAATGGAGYFYNELQGLLIRYETLETSHRELNDQIKAATNDLTDKSGSLEDAQKRIGLMSTSLKKSQDELAAEQQKSQGLATKLANTENARNKLQAEKDQAASTLALTRSQLQEMTATRNKLQNELTDARQTAQQTEIALNSKVAGLEADMAAQQQAYQDEVQGFQQRLTRINSDLDKAKIDLERAQRDFTAEADASRKILQEAEQAKSRNATLTAEVEQLRTELATARNKIVDQQATKTGDLVAFIDEIQQPTVRYREPLTTVRLPRGKQVAMRVLVTEVGNVSKAMLVPDQGLDAATQQALIRNIYLWKFTPPSYQGTLVQAWHTVMVGEAP